MFGIGTTEFLVICAVAIIVVGPQKLPQMAKALGRAMGEFKKASQELKRTIDQDENLAAVKNDFEKAVAEGFGGNKYDDDDEIDAYQNEVDKFNGLDDIVPEEEEEDEVEGAGTEQIERDQAESIDRDEAAQTEDAKVDDQPADRDRTEDDDERKQA